MTLVFILIKICAIMRSLNLQSGIFRFYRYQQKKKREVLNFVYSLLEPFLDHQTLIMVQTIIHEFLSNGQRANLKRVYFSEKQLNIIAKNDYLKGMPDFKNCLLNEDCFSDIKSKAVQEGFWIKLKYEKNENEIFFKIVNNTPMLKEEAKRLQDKVDYALKCTGLMDFYNNHLDYAEGAGLGIALTVFLMRSSHIPVSNLKINVSDFFTEVSFKIKLQGKREKPFSKDELKPLIIFNN